MGQLDGEKQDFPGWSLRATYGLGRPPNERDDRGSPWTV